MFYECKRILCRWSTRLNQNVNISPNSGSVCPGELDEGNALLKAYTIRGISNEYSLTVLETNWDIFWLVEIHNYEFCTINQSTSNNVVLIDIGDIYVTGSS